MAGIGACAWVTPEPLDPTVARAPQRQLAGLLKEKTCCLLRDRYQLRILQRSLLTDDLLPLHMGNSTGFTGAGSGPWSVNRQYGREEGLLPRWSLLSLAACTEDNS